MEITFTRTKVGIVAEFQGDQFALIFQTDDELWNVTFLSNIKTTGNFSTPDDAFDFVCQTLVDKLEAYHKGKLKTRVFRVFRSDNEAKAYVETSFSQVRTKQKDIASMKKPDLFECILPLTFELCGLQIRARITVDKLRLRVESTNKCGLTQIRWRQLIETDGEVECVHERGTFELAPAAFEKEYNCKVRLRLGGEKSPWVKIRLLKEGVYTL